MHARPSAVNCWSLADRSSRLSVTLRTGDGLIELTEYASTTTATESTAGNAKGYESAQKIKQGSSGTAIKLRELKYFKRTVSSDSVFPLARETVYRDDAGTQPIETNYSYTSFTSKLTYQERMHHAAGGADGAERIELVQCPDRAVRRTGAAAVAAGRTGVHHGEPV